MSQKRATKRVRRRMACEVIADGCRQSGIVIDLSRAGLFVQTSTRLFPGTVVELRIRFPTSDEPVGLRARVVRHKAVPANLTSVARGGIGLRILEAPHAYYEALGADEAREAPRVPAGAEHANQRPADTPGPARFRVRMKQIEGPRSRLLDVAAATADAARVTALAQLGSGWEALEAEAI
jgi:hypothetical protein